MSQDHQGYQQQEVHHDLRYHMQHAVIPNTSSSALTHGTGPSATNGPSSSFQTPGESVSSNPHTPIVGDQSRVSSFSSSNQHTPVAAAVRSSSFETWPMGHGQSKPTSPPPRSSIPPQFLTSGGDPVFDAGLTTTGGINVSGKRLKRAFGPKSKESNDSYSQAYKETTGEVITVSKSSSSLSPPTGLTPDSHMSTALPSPPSQVLKYPVTSSSNATPLSQPSASFSGPTMASSPGTHPKSPQSTLGPPAAAGNRSSVIALSPGISSAINFMMMEWQEPSRPQLVVDTSYAAALSISPSLPSGDGESSKANKDNESQKEKETLRRHSGGSAPTSPDRREMKESWRKSDSTNSHHTVRANSLRASRPVSWAESFHSAYTIVPATGATALQGPSARRLSGLLADVDFGVREEELEEDVDANVENSSPLPSHQFATFRSIQDPNKDGNPGPLTLDIAPPPAPYRKSKDLKKANRRSISLSSALPGPMAGLLPGAKPLQPGPPVTTTTPAPSEVRKVSYSISGVDAFRNVSQPHVQTHLRQQSENLLHQRPPVPFHSADVTHHVPSMVFSTSQLTSDSRSMQDNIPPQQPSRGRLNAFLPPLPRHEQGVPAVPPDSLNSPADTFRHAQTPFFPSNSSHLRQPAISGLGPSAAGIAKRAVERMTKRFGDMMNGLSSSSNSSVSGHSSSTSISTSASTSVTSGTSLIPSPLTDSNIRQSQFQGAPAFVPGRTASRGSNPASPVCRQGSGHAHHHSLIHGFLPGPSRSGGHKRFQKSLGSSAMCDIATTASSSASSSSNAAAPSSYNQSFDHKIRPTVSIPPSSSTMRSAPLGDFHRGSTSQSDPFSPTGPILGRRLRGPLKKGHVFGRELRLAVKETKVIAKDNDDAVDAFEGSPSRKVGLIKALECRMLPAVVTRCAQHLLIWGVQEEGLFRVNGGPRHVSHLRAEFDSGADYDMTECSPGELDPHAVASVFKAYLRELPDSILTHKLQPYFDAAINKENSLHTYGQHPKSQTKSHQGLPTSPRNITPDSLRKPPSLSTLAMPSFNQVPPPSKSLINAFRSLIAQLPPENRDLIRTVVDLIKATAKGSKATKMPLSNLLLLFCPSLNLSPPLLRLLCEAEGIWEEERITYVSRGAEEDRIVGSDGGSPPEFVPSRQYMSAPRDEGETDSRSGFGEESSLRSGRTSSDNPSSLDYHASAEEDSLFSEEQGASQRRDIADRPKIPTVYLDTRSHLSSSSVSLLQDDPEAYRHTGSFLVRQDVPDDGSISSGPYSIKNDNLPTSPSLPLLSSSGDSASSQTSSANPSFSNLPLDGDKDLEHQKRSDADLPCVTARASPHIFGTESTEIPKRPFISNPIPITGPLPFPTSRNREQAPTTPSRRRSIPLLSLSSLSNRSNGSPSPSPLSKNSPYLAESRTKKTSLKLLFSKKSSSSLFEGKERPAISLPFLQPPEPPFQQERASPRSASGSDSSVSTPLSAVTAPQGSGFFFLPSGSHDGPPVLNTLIEDSSLKFDELMMPDNDPAKSVVDTPSSGMMGLSSPTTAPTSRSVLDPVSPPTIFTAKG